jgi:hypothetical protein
MTAAAPSLWFLAAVVAAALPWYPTALTTTLAIQLPVLIIHATVAVAGSRQPLALLLFAGGLVLDTIFATPMGFCALLYLAAAGLASAAAPQAGAGPLSHALAPGVTLAGGLVLQAALTALYVWAWPEPFTLARAFLLSLGIYAIGAMGWTLVQLVMTRQPPRSYQRGLRDHA